MVLAHANHQPDEAAAKGLPLVFNECLTSPGLVLLFLSPPKDGTRLFIPKIKSPSYLSGSWEVLIMYLAKCLLGHFNSNLVKCVILPKRSIKCTEINKETYQITHPDCKVGSLATRKCQVEILEVKENLRLTCLTGCDTIKNEPAGLISRVYFDRRWSWPKLWKESKFNFCLLYPSRKTVFLTDIRPVKKVE